MDIGEPRYWDLLIRRSVSRFFLLAALKEKPHHGYELVRCYPGCCEPAEATIYPALHDLLEGGYIQCWTETSGGRERKVCALTDKGQELFKVAARAWQQVIPYLVEATKLVTYQGGEDVG